MTVQILRTECERFNLFVLSLQEVRYADKDLYYGDSSLNSSENSKVMDDYLNEAFDEGECDIEADEDDDDMQENECLNDFKSPIKVSCVVRINFKNKII